ncbi:hypothetical protein HPHPP1_0298 [Helicobacter pylori Hp P-1]|nr:hypothetical protein HPHPP1_0298 [Helicobacter pylori Hp P-1]EJC22755.1 hypothetical protein HPHPP1B_0321 [Helicobacter pylori Hp P-1b]
MVGFLKAFLGGASWGLKGYQSIPPIPLKEWFSLQIKNTH